jgi:hypothetical protein
MIFIAASVQYESDERRQGGRQGFRNHPISRSGLEQVMMKDWDSKREDISLV